MNAHQLAALLLAGPDLPVAIGSQYSMVWISQAHTLTHGEVRVGRLDSYTGPHVLIAVGSTKIDNGKNWCEFNPDPLTAALE